MKRLLLILILTFSFQTLAKADDISDFEIEGISLGDSALDFFTKKQIKDSEYLLGTSDKYLNSYFYKAEYENYDAVEFSYLKNDKNYIIKGLSGGITVTNLNDCKRKYNKINDSLKVFFSNSESLYDEGIHPGDVSGKSKYFRTSYQINPNSRYFEIETSCIFYKGDAANKFTSNAGVTLKTDKMNDWLNNEAYK
jgi:hypothetical protein